MAASICQSGTQRSLIELAFDAMNEERTHLPLSAPAIVPCCAARWQHPVSGPDETSWVIKLAAVIHEPGR